MKLRTTKLTILTVGVACASLSACGPNNKGEEELAQVDHKTAKQAITGNTNQIATKLSTTISFLNDSSLFSYGVENTLRPSVEVCAVGPTDPVTGEPTTTDCTTEEPAPEPAEIDVTVDDEAQELTSYLETHIFTDANVESEDGTSVTYLLKGSEVCAVDGEPTDPGCVQQVDDAEIRLVVTSPVEGDVDVDVLVGPSKSNPFSFEIHSDLLAAEADLGGIKASAQHLESVTGETLDLPQTMQGRVRAQLQILGPEKASAAFSVLQAVKVADGGYSFSVGVSQPALSVTADGAAQTIQAVTNVGAIDGSLPITSYEYDSTTGTETESSYQLGFHIGGITSDSLLDAANELLTLTGVGLGQTTTTFSVDGDEVIAIDLNAADGRAFDATIKEGANDSVEFQVSPKFDLSVALQFAAAAGKIGDIADWMMDDVLSIKLDGTNPTVRASDGGLEVVDGTLTLSLQNAGITHTVDAGMCLLDSADTVIVDGGSDEPVEPGTEPVTPTEEPETNPLEELEVGACQ